MQDNIRPKNRLRSMWLFTSDHALKADVNGPQTSVTRRLKEWRGNDQGSATLEFLEPEDQ
jgi:hypothetical protein